MGTDHRNSTFAAQGPAAPMERLRFFALLASGALQKALDEELSNYLVISAGDFR